MSNDVIRSKILHLLLVYPKISPSMLHIGLGTALPSEQWRPILEELVTEGKVIIERNMHGTPDGKKRMYETLSLVSGRQELRVAANS